jgi:transmembrane sensor
MNASTKTATQVPEELRLQAQAWLRRLNSGEVTEQDARAFRRWHASGPLHRAALFEAKHCWDALEPAFERIANKERAQAITLGEARRPAAWGRRAFLGSAVGAAAAVGVALAFPPFELWPTVGEWRADYRTGTGEQRKIALAERVSVDLNTLTAITRQDVGGRTDGIELISGEAAVDISAPVQGTRGFSVTSGVGRTSADAGHFEVRHINASTCVTCVQGILRVEHPLGTRSMTTGQQVIYDAHSLGDISPADLSSVSAWRRGILVFNLTPLTQVIDEINRYRPGRVVLVNRNVSDRQVSGRFPIRSLNVVLSQIQHTYELNARKLPGGLLLLS